MSAPSNFPENTDSAPTMNVARAHAAVAREKGEPLSNMLPLPLMAVVGIAVITILAGAYFGSNGQSTLHNLKGWVYEPQLPEGGTSAAEIDPYESPEAWIGLGAKVYGTVCIGCHGAGGEGVAPNPPLKNSEFVIHGDKRMSAILLWGVNGPLTVNGKGYNGLMAPRGGAPLSDQQLAQVISYVRNSWGNKGSLVYDDQLAALKKEVARDGTFTESELRAFPQDEALAPSKLAKAPGSAPAAAPAAAPAK